MIVATTGEMRVVRLVDGEALMDSLLTLKLDSGIILGGVGMLRDLEVAYWNGSAYEAHPIAEPVELLSLQGNFARSDAGPVVHAHAAVACRDGKVLGGHVVAATVHNTVEIAIHTLAGITLDRRPEPSGLVGLFPRVEG